MEFISVLVAAAASWVFGAIWYMLLAEPWVEASGVKTNDEGKPANQSKTPFILSAIAMILVAGMMRHVFAMADITGTVKAILAGLGIGAFFITPWILINNAYAGRSYLLTAIDGGYAILGCGIIGAVLTLL